VRRSPTNAFIRKFTPDGRHVLVTTHICKDLVVIDAHTRKLIKRI
jgi:hypothetical protein